ncbi:MAG: LacI family DNA-binding transcriptional regulator [Pseudomonadota bacterium]
MGKRATIRDVAEKAGVSKSTVSLVLHNSPLIRTETKAAVNHAIDELRYVRNRTAAALRSSNSGRIGIIVNDLRSPLMAELVIAVQASGATRGMSVLVFHTGDDPEAERQAVNLALEQDVAGLLVAPSVTSQMGPLETIVESEIPAIQVLRQTDACPGANPFHSFDYAIGSHLATQHLLSQGIEDIAFVGGETDHQIATERMSGYADMMQVSGAPILSLPGPETRRFGQEAMLKIASDYPFVRAAICVNEHVALGMADAAPQTAMAVGENFFLIGFDNGRDSEMALAGITSIHGDMAQFAEATVAALLDWIDSGKVPLELVRRPMRLIERRSSRKM